MMFRQPIPLNAAMASQAVKTVMPTTLRSRMLAELPVALRKRSMFSAGVTNADLLQSINDQLVDVLQGQHTEATARSLLHRIPDMLTDVQLKQESRLRLIVETNVDLARGYGMFQQTQDVDILTEWPAWEFFRAEQRKEPRDWPARWEDAGGTFYPGPSDYPAGRMIALKNDPIWVEISAFDLPYAPFDYNSGMDLQDIDREEAEALGVIKPNEAVQAQRVDFNMGVQASPEAEGGILDALVEYYAGQGIANLTREGVLKLIGGLTS